MRTYNHNHDTMIQNYRDKCASKGYFIDALSNEEIFNVLESNVGLDGNEEQTNIEDIVTLLNSKLK
jgi:hypothetical protein